MAFGASALQIPFIKNGHDSSRREQSFEQSFGHDKR